MTRLITSSLPWNALRDHHKEISKLPLKKLFENDPDRFHQFSKVIHDLLIDYSKCHITQETLALLLQLAKKRELTALIKQFFHGECINTSEQNPALHHLLRQPSQHGYPWDIPLSLLKDLTDANQKFELIVNRLEKNQWLGYSGKPITDIVHIGIGGSHLGPALICDALGTYHKNSLKIHFISNFDEGEDQNLWQNLNPETTLFIIVSKSFTTEETLANAHLAKAWLSQFTQDVSSHFIAVTHKTNLAQSFGIPSKHCLPLFGWTGGRYSLWGSAGLSSALAIGMTNFKKLLAGAHAMDLHFYETPLEENVPVILSLIDIWYSNFFKTQTHAIIPYDTRLHLLPNYLQQLIMESNGKSVSMMGDTVNCHTASIVWGGIGTNSQHSFHQLLFQGTHLIPTEFILPVKGQSQTTQMAHCVAQSLALMQGQEKIETDPMTIHKTISGNQPSTTILLPELSPFHLGALLALYEHRTISQALILDINPFDQWGVELGKSIAKKLNQAITQQKTPDDCDSSTAGLLDFYYQHFSE